MDAIDGRGTGMAAVPNVPGVSRRIAGAPAVPTVRDASSAIGWRRRGYGRAEPRRARSGAAGASCAGQSRPSKKVKRSKRDHERTELKGVGDEFLGQLERRIHHDAFAASGRLALHQKVAAVEMRRVAVIDEVASRSPRDQRRAIH